MIACYQKHFDIKETEEETSAWFEGRGKHETVISATPRQGNVACDLYDFTNAYKKEKYAPKKNSGRI